jgi:hypothetical protein
MRKIIVVYENHAAIHLQVEGTEIKLSVIKPEISRGKQKPALIGGTAGLSVPDAPTAREIMRLLARCIELAEQYNQAAGIDSEKLRYTFVPVNRWK